MKKTLLYIMLSLAIYSLPTLAEDAPASVMKLVPELQAWGSNPVLVAAVKAENSKAKSLAQIQEADKKWMNTTGVDSFMQGLLDNAAAKELKKLETTKPYFTETFLMDNQGANVAMTNKTSDYWQGDEAKFIKSYVDGKGGVDVSKVKFDESSQAYLVQVSVAVMDGGKAIGALTIGINIDKLEAAH